MTAGRPLVRTVLDGWDQIAPYAGQLDSLAAGCDAPASMRLPALQAWADYSPDRLMAVTVRRDGELAAVALLAARRGRLGWQIEKFGVAGEPYRLLAADPEAAAQLADELPRALNRSTPGWELRLTDLPAEDPVAAALAATAPWARRTVEANTPCLSVGTALGLSQADLLSRNVRSAERKALNRLRRDDRRLEQLCTVDPAETEAALPQLMDIHLRRNVQLGRGGLLGEPRERQLYADVLLGQARAGRARLYLTSIDDRIAAFAACFRTADRLWVWSNAVDPDQLAYSPGLLTTTDLIRSAGADPGVDVLDWGAGIQRFKLSGGAWLARTQTLQLGSSRTLGLLRRIGRRARPG